MTIGKILIYIAGLLWGIELIPQIVKTYKTKRVEDISLPFFVMCGLYFIYNRKYFNERLSYCYSTYPICNTNYNYGRNDIEV